MPYISDKELVKQVRQNQFYSVYFLYGQENYLLEKTASLLFRKAVTGQPLFNFVKVDGAKATLEQLSNEVETLPMMSEHRCIAVEDMDLEKLGKSQLKQLEQMIQDLPETTILIFWYPGREVILKKSSTYRNFSKLVEKIGCVTEFVLKTRSDLVKILCKQAEKLGSAISTKAAYDLIDLCGTELNSLLHELDKLAFYALGREITRDDIFQLVTPSVESSSFDLAKAVLQGQYQKAFQILDRLLSQQQDEILLLSAMNTSFLDIYRARAAQSAGQNEDAILQAYSYKGREFRMRNAMRDCSRFSMGQIKRCLDCLMEADIKLKSSRVDHRIILETAVGKMILARQEVKG
ncbi:DNA polymerase III subunit delta [Clostridium facile]|uniref:DNA polymerase III subunit delta n=1 Tax=Clostridium facile TaxID=2763035 RepID=A0ABR7ISB5_9CLOT|nr:DNA polymerase III subunit delta [Clostridium facile]MBC5788034.1 DNA polymerase III subunit delta [Clostridium facile]